MSTEQDNKKPWLELIKLNGPIKEMDVFHQSLLFAELSNISYLPEDKASEKAQYLGLDQHIFFDRDGAQAYLFSNDIDTVIVCRGTEPNEWNDIRADLRVLTVVAETVGRVHRGFKEEVDDIWPKIEPHLENKKDNVWFTGHSLGAAMATICASRCKVAESFPDPIGLFTYGSPRVGNKKYVSYSRINHCRWVNNNDLVTRVPPASLTYRHTGQEYYLNTYGKLRKLTQYQRAKDRMRGFIDGIKKGRIDFFSDHLITNYLQGIYGVLQQQSQASASIDAAAVDKNEEAVVNS